MNDIIEKRFTRGQHEHILIMLEGNLVTSFMANGLQHRQDEFQFDTTEEANEYFLHAEVKILVEGFRRRA